ncbi:hypothetical protein GUITHDRAFT_65027 [Guillardia theta CCMP2712]|uniref:Protein kinase domain-containing protein n=2 Tax=Guillardia theta TaxID=55529 RepID=L1JWF8_GUITC|nr:hypothetical protein GUITHDRAFT_65027 [Guillardia theta CCMP2712]EKX52428.1 hypothetical protein GUITHDRAFT_65027 [Guillardia theta CCMP2712]|mmetsp:Transcript_49012/g.153906  ORF Transcript_49012/g.153906 Transcript_49012/m.153906 type:complete len:346 (+) Transcript_49012:336-1373(+)|eukprot:XP_005839408.1 hypothetical protein GUITHDRAFT_65027 [Guillardia theta CCMP2712]
MRQIGVGTFKLVYQARWQQPHGASSEVAVLRIRGSGSAGRMKEFEQEVKIFQHLGFHPKLLQLLAITNEPGSGDYCMVTELASKGALDVILSSLAKERQTLSLLVQLQVARQICDGMVHLALHGVVHGDLATRNVLVFRLDARNHLDVSVKVADYGLSIISARWYRQSHAASFNTARSMTRPVRWMAPESIERRQFSEKSDVWAFGVTMWEIWTYAEKIPYESVSEDSLVETKVLGGERLPRSPSCPAAVYSIMLECWRERKSERPGFSDLQRKLQQHDLTVAESSSEDEPDDYSQQCVICLEREAVWALIPCGHMCLCEVHKEGAASRPCPICRSNPTSVHRIY